MKLQDFTSSDVIESHLYNTPVLQESPENQSLHHVPHSYTKHDSNTTEAYKRTLSWGISA